MSSSRKVAVVGSGLAGLTSAWLLQQEALKGKHVEVHVFEKASSLGFHSASLMVPVDARPGEDEKDPAKTWTVDVPMRSLQGGYYERLIAMYRKLGIPLQSEYYTYSFSHLLSSSKRPRTHFIHEGKSGFSGVTLPADKDSRSTLQGTLRFALYAVCYLYLLALATWHRWTGAPTGAVKDWTRRVGRGTWGGWIGSGWEEFVQDVLFTLFGAVFTCSDQQLEEIDARLLLDYVYLTVLTPHYSVPTSSASVAQALIASLPPLHVHLSTPIASFKRQDGLYTITAFQQGGEKVTMSGFTDIILATQANQAAAILETVELKDESSQGLKQLLDCLKSFTYVPTIVINHRDSSVLPLESRDHRDLNLVRCPAPKTHSFATEKQLDHFPPISSSTYTMATHIISSPVAGQDPIYQTTTPIVPIDPFKILSISRLERALPNAESTRNIPHLHDLQGVCGLWTVGSYAWEGIPLLEGCVASSEYVVLGEKGILGAGRRRP